VPDYEGIKLPSSTLNSLTKACSGEDFNDNLVPDVHESAESVPRIEMRNASARLADYYREYAKYSFFFELHDGSYEAAKQGKSGAVFRIRERQRNSGEQERQVPVTYAKGTAEYAKRCVRHIDSAYHWQPGEQGPTPMLKSPNTIGADLAHLGDIGWHGMTHHSQYKCVQVLSQASYNTYEGRGANAKLNPELVTAANPLEVLRRPEDGEPMQSLPWYVNRCVPSADSRASGESVGEQFPKFSCTALAVAPSEGATLWAAVGYVNRLDSSVLAANAIKYESFVQGPQSYYKNGCINECVDSPGYAPWFPVNVCHECRVDLPYGEGGDRDKARGAAPCDDYHPDASPGLRCVGPNLCGECYPGEIASCDSGCGAPGKKSCTAAGKWAACIPAPTRRTLPWSSRTCNDLCLRCEASTTWNRLFVSATIGSPDFGCSVVGPYWNDVAEGDYAVQFDVYPCGESCSVQLEVVTNNGSTVSRQWKGYGCATFRRVHLKPCQKIEFRASVYTGNEFGNVELIPDAEYQTSPRCPDIF
jgi:hypothetical protein